MTIFNVVRSSLVAAVAVVGLQATAVSAAVCNPDEVVGVTANAGCQVGTDNNDSTAQVNADMMFGFTDWAEVVKSDPVGTPTMNELSTDGTKISGTWETFDWPSQYANAMIVQKSGAGGTTQPNYVGYLLQDGSTSGDYTSAFFNLNGQMEQKDISHMTLYVRGVSEVPVPAAGLLLVGGLGALGLVRRRRKS